MGNITSCTIDTVYKTFLVINRDGNKDCLVTGAGNVFGGSLAIGGTLTGSITTNHIQVAGLGVNPMYEIYSGSNELLFKINSNGNAEFEERTTTPPDPSSGSGSISFVNNQLHFFGE